MSAAEDFDNQDRPGEPTEPAEALAHAEHDPDADQPEPDDDEPGHDPDVDPDPEPEPEHEQPPAALSAKDFEKINKQLDTETTRHVKRLYEITGAEPDYLIHCPLCETNMQGFLLPRPIEAERVAAVQELLGMRPEANYQADRFSHKCESCDGLGEVLTGSHVNGQEALPCLACDGRGWTPIGNERSSGPPPLVLHQAPVVGELPAAPELAADDPDVAALKARGYVVISPTPPA